MSASTVFSGARAILKLAQAAVGYVVNCSGTTGINYQPLNVLGHLEVVEHVPTAYTVEMTASLARVASVTRLNSGGAANFPGTLTGVDSGADSPQVMPAFGVDGTGSAILTSGELQADIYDRVLGGAAIYTIKGVKCSQKAWEIAAGGMVAENCTFVARIQGEKGENTSTFAA
jgi:hypothetical protein